MARLPTGVRINIWTSFLYRTGYVGDGGYDRRSTRYQHFFTDASIVRFQPFLQKRLRTSLEASDKTAIGSYIAI